MFSYSFCEIGYRHRISKVTLCEQPHQFLEIDISLQMYPVCSAIRSPFTHCRSIDSEAIMLTEQCLFHSQLSGHGTQKEFRIEQLSILDHVATHLLTATSLSFCPSHISVIVVCRSLYSLRCALFLD